MYLCATDLHLDKLTRKSIQEWAREILIEFQNHSIQGVILSGDISISTKLEIHLKELASAFQKPIYFVLGNHDYWFSSFQEMDKKVSQWESSGLFYLENQYFSLSPEVALVGSSGFYDGAFGNKNANFVRMNDWVKIQDFQNLNQKQCLELASKRSAKLAINLVKFIEKAKKNNQKIIIITHVPPFKELLQDLEEEYWPYYGNGNLGNVLYSVAQTAKEIMVLCGHSHLLAEFKFDNIQAYSGGAKYCDPAIWGLLDLDQFKMQIL